MRARLSKEDLQELIQRQADNGFTAQQFCPDNDVCPKYFGIRKKQLGLQQSAVIPFFQSEHVDPYISIGALTPASHVVDRLSFSKAMLCVVVVAQLCNKQRAIDNLVDESMFIINSARPITCKCVL